MGKVTLPFRIARYILDLLAAHKREAFLLACKNPEAAQRKVRQRLEKGSLIPFPAHPVTFEHYKGKTNLTKEKVIFLESTSGSTGVKKEIPYTKGLLKSFENMFLLWAHDIVFHSPVRLSQAKFFMSVSPQIGKNTDDRKYLSPLVKLLLKPFLISDPDTHKATSGEMFLRNISEDLLKAKDLEIISVWSPTYLLSLLHFMDQHKTSLGIENKSWKEIWPELKLISCWTEGQAEKSAENLHSHFPDVMIQPKGLLATEAPVTIPWSEAGGCLPLLTETYLEFLEGENVYQLHEIKQGHEYEVITSQANGFLRYLTGDIVTVTGFYYQTPVLKFLGRAGQSSDLAGEKFTELNVKELLKSVRGTFYLLPDNRDYLPGYILVHEGQDVDWENLLEANYHYKLARELRQLTPLKVIGRTNLSQRYLEFFQNEGMILGDIKERVLFSNPDQAKKFLAWIEKEPQSSHSDP